MGSDAPFRAGAGNLDPAIWWRIRPRKDVQHGGFGGDGQEVDLAGRPDGPAFRLRVRLTTFKEISRPSDAPRPDLPVLELPTALPAGLKRRSTDQQPGFKRS